MSESAGFLPRRFISFCHLGVEFGAHKLPEERESENPQRFDEVDTVEVGETSNSPAEVLLVLQNVPLSSELVMSGQLQKDHQLTIAETDCVMTSSEEDMDHMNAFVSEKLQFMTEKGLEQLVGEESVNVEEILSGSMVTVSGRGVGYEETVWTLSRSRKNNVCVPRFDTQC